MARYIFLLFVMNAYYYNYSNSMPTEPNLFGELANRCHSKLSTEITQKLQECSINVNDRKKFLCLLFYDINSRLCDLVLNDQKARLKQEFTTKMKSQYNIDSFCNDKDSWSFGDIPKHPEYQGFIKYLLTNSSASCTKFCSDDSLTDIDLNYYCKYYKVGIDLLQMFGKPLTATSTLKLVEVAPLIDTTNNASSTDTNTVVNTISEDLKVKDKLQSSDSVNNKLTTTIKPEINNDDNKIVNSTTKQETVNNQMSSPVETSIENKYVLDEKTDDFNVNAVIANQEEEVVNKSNIKNIIKTETEDDKVNKSANEDSKDIKIENNIQNMDTNVEFESEDTDDDETLSDLKPDDFVSEAKFINSKEPSNMETYSEDEDNFIPFFFTAIVLIALLYVLYHNKSKVSKMVLGLIVEGRQPGRRRNSRGHAYRRLDTLEQAMSTNSAAPPSKIIY